MAIKYKLLIINFIGNVCNRLNGASALYHLNIYRIGTWVHGAFVVGAGPALFKLRNAPAMAAKPAVVFCTYALAAGKSLDKLTRAAESMGLTVLGGMLIKRGHLQEGAEMLVERLLAGLPTVAMPTLISR